MPAELPICELHQFHSRSARFIVDGGSDARSRPTWTGWPICSLKVWAFRRLLGYPQTELRNVEFRFGESRFSHSVSPTRSGEIGFGGSRGWSASEGRPVLDMAEIIMTFAANARYLVPRSKILFLGAFAPLLVVAATSIFFRADVPSVKAYGTLNCYDSAGNYKPCVTRVSASTSQLNDRTTGVYQPSWATTALFQQAIWPTNAVDQPENLMKSAPAARRSSTSGKRPATCARRLIPCFLSALRRRLTHIASVGQTRPVREHL